MIKKQIAVTPVRVKGVKKAYRFKDLVYVSGKFYPTSNLPYDILGQEKGFRYLYPHELLKDYLSHGSAIAELDQFFGYNIFSNIDVSVYDFTEIGGEELCKWYVLNNGLLINIDTDEVVYNNFETYYDPIYYSVKTVRLGDILLPLLRSDVNTDDIV